MKVAILKETNPRETRVACSPEIVKKMIAQGIDVRVETGAGTASSFQDEQFKAAGAIVTKTPRETLANADVVFCVRQPDPKSLESLAKKALVASLLSSDEKEINAYLDSLEKHKLSAIALEYIPRISRAQSMDVLSSQANLAGYRSVIDAVYEYGRAFPMMMTAAGTVPPAKVLIVGAGVAGLQAIATARRLGAVVSAFDVRAAAKEQVESLGAKFIEVESDDAGDESGSETKGGYAKESSEAYKKRQAEKLAEAVSKHDIVITTALIPGKPAPRLISKEMVDSMKPGSVLVDLALERGGNIEGSAAEKIISKNGKKIIGFTNFAGRLAAESSSLFARNCFHLLSLMFDKDKKELSIDQSDEIIKGSLIVLNGQRIHPNFTTAPSSDSSKKSQTQKGKAKNPAPKKATAAKGD